jgi:hypothetical protein
MTALIVLSFVTASCVFGACGDLTAKTLSPEARGRASAWLQAGMQGSGALGGAAIIWLAARSTLRFVGFCTGLVIALPRLLALAVPEPPPAFSHIIRGRLSQIGHEVYELLRSSSRRWGAILLISPIGTGAAMFLLAAIASNYGVGVTDGTWINGVGGGVVTALGALAGALIPGDWDTRLVYAAAGVSSALAALVLLTAAVPATYLAGTALYLFTNGFCQARYAALVVEIVGAKTEDASVLFSILLSMYLIATTYTIWLEGAAYHRFGTHGLLWTEAAGGLVVGAVVFAVFAVWACGARPIWPSQRATHSLPSAQLPVAWSSRSSV